MRFIAIMMVFNCGDVVGRALASLDGRVDEIHCFDSRWITFTCVSANHSTDNTREVIEEFAKTSESKIFYHLAPEHMEEWEGRTYSLSCTQNGDWVFVFDADETIKEFPENLRAMLEQSTERGYRTLKAETGTPHTVCRLFRKIEGMYYTKQDKLCAPDVKYDKWYMKDHFKMSGIVFLNDLKEKRRVPHASTFVVKHRQQHAHP